MPLLLLLTDEDFCGPIIDGLRRRFPELNVLRAVEAGLSGKSDDEILAWCAEHGRTVVSHDVNTMIAAALDRSRSGLPIAGLIAVPQWLAYSVAIEQIYFVAAVCTPDELDAQIVYLPL